MIIYVSGSSRGYSKEIELAYDRPNTGKNLIHGFGGGFLISGQEQVDAITTNNQQVFVNARHPSECR